MGRMRHTRNRQLYKLTGDKHWQDTYNVTIEFNRKWAPLDLDPTFKWHREYNNVSFDVIHYYPHKVTVPLYVDLYKEDSVYY